MLTNPIQMQIILNKMWIETTNQPHSYWHLIGIKAHLQEESKIKVNKQWYKINLISRSRFKDRKGLKMRRIHTKWILEDRFLQANLDFHQKRENWSQIQKTISFKVHLLFQTEHQSRGNLQTCNWKTYHYTKIDSH
jgi:selenocysteine-specific translation elongation factor